MTINYSTYHSSFGNIAIASIGEYLCAIEPGNDNDICNFRKNYIGTISYQRYTDPLHYKALSIIDNALIFNLPIKFLYGTEFQKEVWEALLTIPYGEVRSYKEIAIQIGSPKASRAVANACSANPIWLIVPCHRAIHSDGSIEGYRWGNYIKQSLLKREKQK